MWYNTKYENTHFYPTVDRKRTTPDSSRIAFVRCVCVASLPDITGLSPRRTSSCDRPSAWVRRPDGAQRDPRLQCFWTGRLAARVVAPASLTNELHGPRGRTPQRRGSHRSPCDFGQDCSTWTLELAAQVSFEQGIITTEVSDECVRRALKRLKTHWKRAKHWITSPDPLYLQKKTHVIG